MLGVTRMKSHSVLITDCGIRNKQGVDSGLPTKSQLCTGSSRAPRCSADRRLGNEQAQSANRKCPTRIKVGHSRRKGPTGKTRIFGACRDRTSNAGSSDSQPIANRIRFTIGTGKDSDPTVRVAIEAWEPYLEPA